MADFTPDVEKLRFGATLEGRVSLVCAYAHRFACQKAPKTLRTPAERTTRTKPPQRLPRELELEVERADTGADSTVRSVYT